MATFPFPWRRGATSLAVLGWAMAVPLLSGCAASTADVVADTDKYLADAFTPAQLAPSVRQAVEQGEAVPDRFKQMRLSFKLSGLNQGQMREMTGDLLLNNLGNGYVQSHAKIYRNGMPEQLRFELSFGNIHPLKRQSLILYKEEAGPAVDAKAIIRLDRNVTQPEKGATYVFERTMGRGPQLDRLPKGTTTCVAGDAQPAAAMHPSLTGNAIALRCTTADHNRTEMNHTTLAWLADYGVALPLEERTRSALLGFKYTSVSVMR